ncbi:MAG: C1 family peptidase, partial [Bacteroidales bacterium]
MKKTFLIFLSIGLALSIQAQTIDNHMLEQFRSGFVKDNSTGAFQNILTGDANIAKLAKNREVAGKTDHYFKYRVDVKGITNQYSSGRCWMFTSLNVLRPDVRDIFQTESFAFSHNYLYFWDMLEKSNL